MVAIFMEGLDRCGKSSQIKLIMKHLAGRSIQIMHYTAIKGLSNEAQVEQFKKTFNHMFSLLQDDSAHWILDRSHVGDWVYSQKYRKHKPFWIWDLEKTWGVSRRDDFYLILLYDSSFKSLQRDDGDGFSVEKSDVEEEIQLFKEAVSMSSIQNKIVIDINGLDIPAVENLIWQQLQEKGIQKYLTSF